MQHNSFKKKWPLDPKVKRLALFYSILILIPTLSLILAINFSIWYVMFPDVISAAKDRIMEKIHHTKPVKSATPEQLTTVQAWNIATQMWPTPFTTVHYVPFVRSTGLNTNDLGYRGTMNYNEQIALAKAIHSRGGKVVVFTGGSSAFGAGSSADERCIVGLLNVHVKSDNKDVVFFNFCMGYYTSNEELAALVFYASALQPDLLIVMDGYNDLLRACSQQAPQFNRSPFLYHDLVSFLYGQSGLPLPQEQSFLAKIIRPDENYLDQVLETYKSNIKAMIGIMKYSGGKCIFLTQPVRMFMNSFSFQRGGRWQQDPVKLAIALKRLSQITETICKGEPACYYLNVSNIFSNIKQKDSFTYMLDNCHMTDTGQQMISERVYPVAVKMLNGDPQHI